MAILSISKINVYYANFSSRCKPKMKKSFTLKWKWFACLFRCSV